GSDGPPTCYEDFDLADLIFIIGSNMAEAHPVLFDRIKAAKQARPGMTIVVVDPRQTQTARAADIHLAVRPGSDIALLNALGRLLLDSGALDEGFIGQHTTGYEDYRNFLLTQNVHELCATAGVEVARLVQVARRWAWSQSVLSGYCMGMGQSTVG